MESTLISLVESIGTNHPECLTEDMVAKMFSETFSSDIQWIEEWHDWFIWNDQVWEKDITLAVPDKIRSFITEISNSVSSVRQKQRLQSLRFITSIEKLLRIDRRHAATSKQWDNNPWILNTPEGTIDLQTGQYTERKKNYYLTKSTSISPNNNCPTWFKFLKKITDNNYELEAYLGRIAGYALTGNVKEHAFFFFYGSGRNGKSTFVDTLLKIYGDYALTSPMTTFMASRNSDHPTELARLQGARLTVSQETESGKHWSESRIKAITGGDPITARFMRQDYFTFSPQFKLIITGNHKPLLSNVDEAMRRRLQLVPFNVTITDTEQDSDLPNKLLSEASGILSWAIQGCLNWQNEGLSPPDIVKQASDDYFEEEDLIQLWIDDCCMTGNEYIEQSTNLYKSHKNWLERSGEFVISQKKFSRSLIDHDFRAVRNKTGQRAFKGISLNQTDFS
jgi:putative DNA primase/helicase